MPDATNKNRRRRVHANRCVTQQKNDEALAELVPQESRTDFERRLRRARKDPAKALQAEKLVIGRSRAEHDRASLIPSFVAYEAAGALKTSIDEWKKFASDPLWRDFGGHKPDPEKSDEHLRWAMNFVHEAKDKRGKDRANVYRGALQAQFEQGAKVETLFAFIKSQGGVDAAYRKAPRLPSATREGAATNLKVGNRNTEDSTGEDRGDESSGVTNGSEEGGSGSSSNVASEVHSRSDSASSNLPPVDIRLIEILRQKAIETQQTGLRPMLIALTPRDFASVVLRRLHIGGEVDLQCKVVRNAHDGWVAVTCSKIRPRSPNS